MERSLGSKPNRYGRGADLGLDTKRARRLQPGKNVSFWSLSWTHEWEVSWGITGCKKKTAWFSAWSSYLFTTCSRQAWISLPARTHRWFSRECSSYRWHQEHCNAGDALYWSLYGCGDFCWRRARRSARGGLWGLLNSGTWIHFGLVRLVTSWSRSRWRSQRGG